MLPGPAPGLADRRIALAPFGLELLEPDKRLIGVLGPIDRLDRRQDGLAVFPGHKRQTVADQVHDAGLDQRLGIDRRDRLRKALEPVDNGDQDVVQTPDLQLVHNLEPEFCALRCPRTSLPPSVLSASAT